MQKTIKVVEKGIKKQGQSARGPWRIVGVKDEEGQWYYGFDNKFSDYDSLQPGTSLQVNYQWNDKYKQNDLDSTEVLIDIKSDEIPWQGAPPPQEPPPFKHCEMAAGIPTQNQQQTITGESAPEANGDAMKACLWEALDEVDEVGRAVQQRYPGLSDQAFSAILECVQRVAVSKYIQKSRG